jgi:hypothetical protein
MNLLAEISSILCLPFSCPVVFGPKACEMFGCELRPIDRELPWTSWHYRLSSPVWVIAPEDAIVEEADLPVMGARFGRFGVRSLCDRVWVEVEHATRFSEYYTIALLPASYFDEKHDAARRKLVSLTHSEVMRCWIDGSLIGSEQARCLIVWRRTINKLSPPVLWRVRTDKDLIRLKQTVRDHAWQPYLDKLHEHLRSKVPEITPQILQRSEARPLIVTPRPSMGASVELGEVARVRVYVAGGAKSVKVRALNTAGKALLESMRSNSLMPVVNSSVEAKTTGMVAIDSLLLRESMLVQYPELLDRKINYLIAQGAEVEQSHDLRAWLERRLKRYHSKLQLPFEQSVRREDGEWEVLHAASGPRALHPHRYQELLKRAASLPWKTWGFHHDDLARTIIKGSALYVADQGTGKTRFTLSSVWLRAAKCSLLVLEARLIPEFMNEVKAIGFPLKEVHVIEHPEDARPEKMRRINLVAYSRLGRGVKVEVPVSKRKRTHHRVALTGAGPQEARRRAQEDGEKKASDRPYQRTLAHLLRKVRFHTIYCDEGHRLANLSAQMTQGVMLLRSKHVVVMSGTPIKNYPDGALALWMRVSGERSVLCPYSESLPIPLEGQRKAISGGRRYRELFVSYKSVKSQYTGKKSVRKIPLIPEESLGLWREQLSLIMCRRSMHEPDVASEIPLPSSDISHLEDRMDDDHILFYQWWLDQFFEWMKDQIQQEASGRKSADAVSILTQLGKLDFATGFPQAPQLALDMAPKWRYGLTTKQKLLLSTLETMAPKGYKSIVFATHPDFLEMIQEELEDRQISSILIHGSIPAEKRAKEIARYRTDDSVNVMLAAYKAANTGYNIPEADVVYCYDWPWVPSEMDQAEKRMIRPAWLTEERRAMGAQPMIRRMVQIGGLDEYKRQLVYLKAQGADQAINHQQASFDAESWLSYRDFAIKMLRDRGYGI